MQTTNEPIVHAETPTRPLAGLWTTRESRPIWTAFVGQPTEANADAFFEYERAAFVALLPILGQQYLGQFVAVHGGKVVESDPSQAVVVRRFFERFGDTHVYIGFVGAAPMVYQISPFRM